MTFHDLTPDGSRIDARVADARNRLARIDPVTAAERQEAGHLLVDIRPRDQRRAEGEIPGSIVIERNVLEWRLDPTSDARVADFAETTPVIVFCQQGYTSSLAAADLLELGRTAVTDIDGGFEAWRDAGLPVMDGGRPADFS
jgi:rhodanese-related sulfurtransferase